MATKTIDVTLVSIQNVGPRSASPKGGIWAQVTRAVSDEQVFHSEPLYLRHDGPIHPSGATHIQPGQSLSYNVTKRLTVSRFPEETEGQLNQMLVISRELTEDLVIDAHEHPNEPYQGSFTHKLQFDEIDGFNVMSLNYNVVFGGEFVVKIVANFTVVLVSSS